MEEKIKTLQKRVATIEFFLALLFSACITLIYAIIKIMNIYWLNWSVLFRYFILVFFITLLVIYIILPIIQIVEKVGINIRDIWKEFAKEFNEKARLGKIKMVLSLIVGILAIIEFILKFIK